MDADAVRSILIQVFDINILHARWGNANPEVFRRRRDDNRMPINAVGLIIACSTIIRLQILLRITAFLRYLGVLYLIGETVTDRHSGVLNETDVIHNLIIIGVNYQRCLPRKKDTFSKKNLSREDIRKYILKIFFFTSRAR